MKRAVLLWLVLCIALTVPAMAREDAPRPALELQRSVSKEFVGQGGSAVLIYRVENTGNVPLEDVFVTDPLCGKVLSLESLTPGAYETAQVNVTVTQKCESAPQAVWHYGGMRYERALEGVVIAPAENRLKAALASDRSGALSGETASLTVYLANGGNTELYDVRFTDEALGDLGSYPGRIAPGETAEWTFAAKIVQSTVFRVTVTARTQSDETISAQTNEVRIVLAEDPNQAQLKIAAAQAEGESPKGTARVVITLVNEGQTPIDGVTISERTLGPLRTLASVAPGETKLEVECAIEETREMLFLAQFSADDGGRTTVLSEKIKAEPGTGQPDRFLQGDPVQLGTSAYAVFMYVGLGALALLACVMLLKWEHRRRRKRIAREKRARRMRLLRKNARMSEAEWVQTRPHKPVSLAQDEKKQS